MNSLAYSATISPASTATSPGIIYDTETNDGMGLQVNVTLAAPAQVIIPVYVDRLFALDSLPADTDVGLFDRYRSAEWMFNWRENEVMLEPGSYTFYSVWFSWGGSASGVYSYYLRHDMSLYYNFFKVVTAS